jgi:hypothetical protein
MTPAERQRRRRARKRGDTVTRDDAEVATLRRKLAKASERIAALEAQLRQQNPVRWFSASDRPPFTHTEYARLLYALHEDQTSPVTRRDALAMVNEREPLLRMTKREETLHFSMPSSVHDLLRRRRETTAERSAKAKARGAKSRATPA